MRRAFTALLTTILLAATMTAAHATPGTTTLSFVAHQDDDLLFMNPDIASDIKAGYQVWVVYLTAGQINDGHDMDYANSRIEGVRAAYAEAAQKPNRWIYEPMWFNGHELATNRLDGTNLHLGFTFVKAASGGGCDPNDPVSDARGDLYRMLHDDSFVAQPIDGRAPYTRASFTGMLHDIIREVEPDYIRSLSSIGHRLPPPNTDHVDHVSSAILAADADTVDGNTWIRRDEYDGYVIESYPKNVFGDWAVRKTEIWDQYWPKDPALDAGSHREKMERQYRPEGRIFWPGTAWVGPGDLSVCGD
ncbi:MAG TPA: PIG-L family deacetylase [Lentzea sp.]